MKLLLGGSPCTRWSIAQTKNRETEPSGIGWELFENYLIALYKFKPDYFLYENNKSMSKAIRDEITKRFGFEPICINSAKLSAQNRQRLYWCGKRNPDGTYSAVTVKQPDDKGILLRDILESWVAWNEKSYNLTTRCCGAIPEDTLKRHRHTMVAEPVSTTKDGKSYTLKANYYKSGPANALDGAHFPAPMAAEPVRIGTIESGTSESDWDSKQYRVYSPDGKSVTMCGQGGGVGAKTGLYAIPYQEANYSIIDGAKVIIANGKIRQGDELGSKQGKYVYLPTCEKSNTIGSGQAHNEKVLQEVGRGENYRTVYEVRNGLITINGKQYRINLSNGCYIIRKLTVTECKRLQTVPDSYVFPVSDTQAYKMLGNGWTVDVIAHILSYCSGITTEPLDVLSMYDGMACGHIALDKLGATIARYRATEIDKYAIKTACHNFPDIEQIGDAFQVREKGWNMFTACR